MNHAAADTNIIGYYQKGKIMKIGNVNFILKGIFLLSGGLVIALFPGIISKICYIIGAIVVISCILTLITSGGGGFPGLSIGGIIIGILIMFLPKLLSISLPMIVGILFASYGISRIVKGINGGGKNTRTNIIFGIIVAVVGVFIIFNPFKSVMIARYLIGGAMLLMAAFNFYVAYVISQRNKNSTDKIIDIDDFSVK